jgi:WD40 repeat protein
MIQIRFATILILLLCLSCYGGKNKTHKGKKDRIKKSVVKKNERKKIGTNTTPKNAVVPHEKEKKSRRSRKKNKKNRAAARAQKTQKTALSAAPVRSFQGTQQAGPLIGTLMTENASSGQSVALSADGSTLAIGAPNYNNALGGVWIFLRGTTPNTWSQQAGPLSGGAAYDLSYQGACVALSASGNVLAVGAPGYNTTTGAVWLFIRDELGWKECAGPLSGTTAVTDAMQGFSVCLSSDGNTLAIGAPGQADGNGVVYLFANSPIGWTQQNILTINNALGARFGSSLSFSSDGNFLAIGGPNYLSNKGAVWIFMKSPTGWSQQAGPLMGTAFSGFPGFGTSVALSQDGSTLAFGGPFNSEVGFEVGGVTVYTRNASTWTLQADGLVAQPYQGFPAQGAALSLSADGNTLAVGGPMNMSVGAYAGGSWIFKRSGASWTQQPGLLMGQPFAGESHQGTSIALSGDGSTLAVGGPDDNGTQEASGAVWIFS